MKQTSRAAAQQMPLPLLIVITVLLLASGVFLGAQLWMMGVLPWLLLALYVLLLAGLTAALWLLRRNTGADIVIMVLALLFSVSSSIGGYLVWQVNSAVSSVTTETEDETQRVSLVVLDESAAQSVSDLADATVGYADDNSLTDSIGAISGLREAVNGEVNFRQYSDILSAVEALLNGEIDALMLNETYLDIIEGVEGYESFTSITRVLYSFEIVLPEKTEPVTQEQQTQTQSVSSVSAEPESEVIAGDGENTFLIYLSGIDTYGDISTRSRSDVNILAAVNLETKQIQLINTPRDYYVPLPNSSGVRDKLTHAGIYGIDCSIGTLEDLYGAQIDYYVRLNFSGFEEIIDELGGIDVNSEYDFTAGGTHFVQGTNHLSGSEALSFARERHAFADGDIQRGRNQMAVISGLINKLTSADVLAHYSEVLDSLSDCFQTDMDSNRIYSFVRRQLESMDTGWTLDTYTVTGTGSMETTYSMPGSYLYVMYPDYSTVATAQEKLKAVLS